MGDVYEAMNRANKKKQQEQGESPPPAPDSSPAPIGSGGDEQPALPLDQVPQKSIAQEDSTRTAVDGQAARSDPVATATDKAQQERHGRLSEAGEVGETVMPANIPPAAMQLSGMNGYSQQMVVHHDRASVITEQYRSIRTQVLAKSRSQTQQVQVNIVTSSAPQEGKSVTSANLGICFSELRNKKVLLVEGDLRRPSFHRLFQREATPGMLQFLRNETEDLDEIVHPTVYENLQFIPAGGREASHSTEMLSSPRMAQLMDRLRDRYDFIFIDTPPVITVTDACILGAMGDQTLLVIRLNKTPTELIDRARRLLRASDCEIGGVILTHQALDVSRYMYRYLYRYYR